MRPLEIDFVCMGVQLGSLGVIIWPLRVDFRHLEPRIWKMRNFVVLSTHKKLGRSRSSEGTYAKLRPTTTTTTTTIKVQVVGV